MVHLKMLPKDKKHQDSTWKSKHSLGRQSWAYLSTHFNHSQLNQDHPSGPFGQLINRFSQFGQCRRNQPIPPYMGSGRQF